MAIAGIPTNFFLQTASRKNYLSWDITVGATSYDVQRSLDGVNYSSVASPAVAHYSDTAVIIGTQYWYKIASVNVSGTSPYTSAQTAIPAPTAEMSLLQLRTLSQQKADMVNNQFITLPEWNTFISLAMYELYDMLITIDEEYFVADPVQFQSAPNQSLYPLPDGALTFTNGNTNQTFVAPSFYKFKGQDLGLDTSPNAFVTINKFSFIDRNQFIYPNTASQAYGAFNLKYRLQGNNVKFIPTPSFNQTLQLWYIPRLNEMVADTDMTTLGYSGWLQYVIVRAAKYAIDKQDLDSTKLDQELLFLTDRINSTSANRDTGQPDTISDIRKNGWNNGSGGGFMGPMGAGW